MNLNESIYFNLMRIKDFSELYDNLKNIKHVVLDMDGTIYNGSTLFPFTIAFLDGLENIGIGYSFLTNNPSKSINDYLAHLSKMGIPTTREKIYTSAQATIDFIKINYPEMKRLFILGTPSMIKEFENAGFISTLDNPEDKPDGVVVGFDMSLTYARLCRATWWIQNGLPYIATNPDKVCPTDQPITLIDCGSICSCIEKATDRGPDIVIGKPDAKMLDGILERYSLKPSEVAMIGDRIYTDIQLAKNANALGVLVLTGETTTEDVKLVDSLPDIIVEDLSVFGKLIQNTRNSISIRT